MSEPVSPKSAGAALISDDLPPELGAKLSPEERRLAVRALSLMGFLGACSMVGVAFSLYLINHYPLLLVAISPIGRHLVLAAPNVDPFAFILVAGGRRLLFYVASFQLGTGLGPSGLIWLELRMARVARFVRLLERVFERWSYLVLVVIPGPTVSCLAGIARMPMRVFVPLVCVGLVLRMMIVIAMASWLREPIEALLELVDAYWVPGTILMVLGVLVYRWKGGGAVPGWPARRPD
jgi:membrane protein DedA with SNARE-associated domain